MRAFLLFVLGACAGKAPSPGDAGAVDADGDGVIATRDCDDGDPAVHPDATEQCNGHDDDCDELVDDADPSLDRATTSPWYPDSDGDTYGDPRSSVSACAAPAGYVDDARDCDDTDREIRPGAVERCDGVDNDCSGATDEGLGSEWFEDADGDGYGSPIRSVHSCVQPAGYVTDATDCLDSDPDVHPRATEQCDGRDDDCDGAIDEGLPSTAWYLDLDGDGYGSDASATSTCHAPPGFVEVGGDCDDANEAIHPGAPEVCNAFDDDCDHRINDGLAAEVWYRDGDGDGYGGDLDHAASCAQPAGYTTTHSDCDDGNRTIHPDASEVCNRRDDNCDGQIDERTVEPIWYFDRDRDGFGSLSEFSTACDRPSLAYTHDASDCDDRDASVNPEAAEVCDGVDDNCDGLLDADDPTAVSWSDADGDGSGDASAPLAGCPEGSVDNGGDCDDTDPARYPSAVEVCNDVDDDCDGSIDDVLTADKTSWYPDADGDGLGTYDGLVRSCTAPSADAVLVSGDCDDSDPAVGSCAWSGTCTGTVDMAWDYTTYEAGYEMSHRSASCTGTLTLDIDTATGTLSGSSACGHGLESGAFAVATLEGSTDGAHTTGIVTDEVYGRTLAWSGDFTMDTTLTLVASLWEENDGWGTDYQATWTFTGACAP